MLIARKCSQTISNKNGNQCSVDSVHCSFLRLSENFSGAATVPFSREIIQVLMSPINENDVEIKPDGKTTCGEIYLISLDQNIKQCDINVYT